MKYETFLDALDQVGNKPNKEQDEAVQAGAADPLFIVAGPGTGKTATLTMRMLKLVFVDQIPPSGIMATTFTKKAAAELRSRLLKWGYGVQDWLLAHGDLKPKDTSWVEQVDINQVKTGTLDSFCEELLRDFRAPGTTPPILADEFVSKTIMLNYGLHQQPSGYYRKGLNAFLKKQSEYAYLDSQYTAVLMEIWSRRYNDQLDVSKFRADPDVPKELDDALTAYEKELEARSMVDFVMLEQKVLEGLVAKKFKAFTKDLKAVLVDEYQDTNLLQERLYFALAKQCDGALTVVGDDDQSLYRFRGATVDLFRDFVTRYQKKGGFTTAPTPIFLNKNYRSSPEIIKFVNTFAELDLEYQSVRVSGKPALINPNAATDSGVPVLGMFRDSAQGLAKDLAKFIEAVTNRTGYTLPASHGSTVIKTHAQGDIGTLPFYVPLQRNPQPRATTNSPSF